MSEPFINHAARSPVNSGVGPLLLLKGTKMVSGIDDMFVVEWSRSQKQFHIHSVGEMLEGNLRAALHGFEADYLPVAIVPTESEADQIAAVIEAKMNEPRLLEDSSGNLH